MMPLLVPAIDDEYDEERMGEGMERVWGPLPLECTAEFEAHAPVCSFVVRPVLDVDLLDPHSALTSFKTSTSPAIRRYGFVRFAELEIEVCHRPCLRM